MGGGALAAFSLSITDVRLEFGQADFPLVTTQIHRHILRTTISTVSGPSYLRTDRLVGRDDHVPFGLAVVAHALDAVDLGQLVDDLPVLPVHRRKAVAPLWLFSLWCVGSCCLCDREQSTGGRSMDGAACTAAGSRPLTGSLRDGRAVCSGAFHKAASYYTSDRRKCLVGDTGCCCVAVD
ncbi:hypothetical protein GOODEAATRI_000948 [Goodea atripinnis]|uniref:Uncharacterized protein n=1 Tax=Goodea atripinnis TaxID=208336 RepID=A0ABV0N702_9TELE